MDMTVSVPSEAYELLLDKKLTISELAETMDISNRLANTYSHIARNGRKTVHSLQRDGEVVGAFGCPHLPFDHVMFLNFLVETFDARGVTSVLCLGDVIDNHAISFHTKNPDGYSPGDELEKARRRIEAYCEMFPKVDVVLGNHDLLPYRKAEDAGLSKEYIKTPQDIWLTPDGWTWQEEIDVDGVRYVHGTGMGKAAPLVRKGGQSVVMSHWHSEGYVQYSASWRFRTFGVQVGCGIDHRAYAMAYGKAFKEKPILGCAIIRGGVEAEFIPMPLELLKYRN